MSGICMPRFHKASYFRLFELARSQTTTSQVIFAPCSQETRRFDMPEGYSVCYDLGSLCTPPSEANEVKMAKEMTQHSRQGSVSDILQGSPIECRYA